MAKYSFRQSQAVDYAKIQALEADLKQLIIIRNNMPKEHWGHIEHKMAEVRAQIEEIKEQARINLQNIKIAMIKAILICDYITDVAEDFVDASKKMTHSGDSGEVFRDMVKSCSDRHEICMTEWGEIVGCIDKAKGWNFGTQYSDMYDKFKDKIDPIVDEYIEELKKTKFWDKL